MNHEKTTEARERQEKILNLLLTWNQETTIQTSAESLANICLEQREHQGYTDRDLLNASLIFSHFLLDVIWRTNLDLPQEKKLSLAKTTGEAIRELIKASTGKDMHDVANNI